MTRPDSHEVTASFIDRHYDAMLACGEEAYMGPPYVHMTGLTKGTVWLSSGVDAWTGYEVGTRKLQVQAPEAYDTFEARGFSRSALETGIWVVKAAVKPTSGLNTPAPPWQPAQRPLQTYAHYEAGEWQTVTTSNIHGPTNEDAPHAPLSEIMKAAIARIAQESAVFHDMAATFRTDAALYEGMRRLALARADGDSTVENHTIGMYMRTLFASESEQPLHGLPYRYAYAWPKPSTDYFTSFQFQGEEPATPEEIVALSLGAGEASDNTARTLPSPYPAYDRNVDLAILRQHFFSPETDM